MAEGDYEYECSRAELLGITRPSRDEFMARQSQLGDEKDEEEIVREEVENIDLQGEGINRTRGGLDELNNILSITQKKINRFKTVCGSFTSLLKMKVGQGEGEGNGGVGGDENVDAAQLTSQAETQDGDTAGAGEERRSVRPMQTREGDISGQVGSQIDKLDSMIGKAEQLELSMSKQNKQMRQHLNK